MKTNLTDT